MTIEQGSPWSVSKLAFAPMRWWHIETVCEIEDELFGVERWSPATFWSELAQIETRWYRVAVAEGGLVVGYTGLCVYGDPSHGEAWVQTVGVRPSYQGRGVGSALLRSISQRAEDWSAESLGLEVRADNVGAQRLYRRFGFTQVGLRRGYYQPSNTDAVVMLKQL